MYGTLRYDKRTKSHEHVQLLSADGIEARGYTPIACDACRARKLKCSGGQDGCDRCQVASVLCTYRNNNVTARSGKRKQRRLSMRDHAPKDSLPTPVSDRTTDCEKSPARQQGNAAQTAPSEEDILETLEIRPSSLLSTPTLNESPSSWLDLLQDPFGGGVETDPHDVQHGLVAPPADLYQYAALRHEACSASTSMPDCSNARLTTWEDMMDINNAMGLDGYMNPHRAIDRIEQATTSGKENDRDSRQTLAPTASIRPNIALITASGTEFSSSCQCVSTMAQLLETMGAEGAGTSVDILLMRVGCGMRTCEGILNCSLCNTCTDNGMLLATVAQQLGNAARSITHGLLNRPQNDRNGGAPAMPNFAIWFGCYQVELPKCRAGLVLNTILLHLARLQTLLRRMKVRIRQNSVAWTMLIDSEGRVAVLNEVVRQQLAREMTRALVAQVE